VGAADIMEYDLDGNPLDERGRKSYLERFIHGEIYRTRPDVQAVVHSHSPSVIPFGVTGSPLRPIFHMSGFLGASAPVFEIREAGGPATDMLIRDRKLGAALARVLGAGTYALMRGHGSIAVGGSVKEVVYRAIYAEVNAKLQSEAMRLGEVTYLNEREAANAMHTINGVIDRPWDLWKSGVAGKRK
jgi:HCOMODA/2-hydroxy-3-carboxy-muconic semialdehyde decarboxylase